MNSAAAHCVPTLRTDELYGTGAIVADIWAHIWQAAGVIADVTGKNPNVNYELGLCHALGVPTVLMTRTSTMCRLTIVIAGASHTTRSSGDA
jgi:hypothetical protein